MAKLIEKHEIADGLRIEKFSNSQRWYARFVVNGEWYTRATKEENKKQAIEKAYELRIEYRTKAENDIPIKRTKRAAQHLFPQVAELAISRMTASIAAGSGKSSYDDYVSALNRYHKEFFKTDTIMDIDRERLLEFDQWRKQKFGHVPAKSTILTHNAAMQRVFDEAVIRKYMVATQIPALANNGRPPERRAAFTKDEFNHLIQSFWTWGLIRQKEVSKQIRTLLYYYVLFVAGTGTRPGTEMEEIRWSDIQRVEIDGTMHTVIAIRKGKTTLHTGTRRIIADHSLLSIIQQLKEARPNRKPNDRVFVLPDGSETKELSRNFGKLLEHANLKTSPFGNRVLYSLRHSYITWQLQRGTNLNTLAVQCGTSVEVIETNYRHLVPEMNAAQLAGPTYHEINETIDSGLNEIMPSGAVFVDEMIRKYGNK